MDTWESVHAGDTVLGHDGNTYGVLDIKLGHPAGPIIMLTRYGVVTGPAQPPPGTPITVVQRVDLSAEAAAFATLAGAGLGPILIGETYHS